MSFSQEVWQRNLGLYQKTLALPFNQQLAQGTLSREAFSHYVIQDAHIYWPMAVHWPYVLPKLLKRMM